MDEIKENDSKRIRLDSEANDDEENPLQHNDEMLEMEECEEEEEKSELESESESEEETVDFRSCMRRMHLIDSKKLTFGINDTYQLDKLYEKFMNKKHFEAKARVGLKSRSRSVYEINKIREERKEREQELMEYSEEVATENYLVKAKIAILRTYATDLMELIGFPKIDLAACWNDILSRRVFGDRWTDPDMMSLENSSGSSTSGVGTSASDTITLNTNEISAYGSGSSSMTSSSESPTVLEMEPGTSASSTAVDRLPPPTITPGPWSSMAPIRLTAPSCSPSKSNPATPRKSPQTQSQTSPAQPPQANNPFDQPGPSTSSAPYPSGPWNSSAPRGLTNPAIWKIFFPTPNSSDSD